MAWSLPTTARGVTATEMDAAPCHSHSAEDRPMPHVTVQGRAHVGGRPRGVPQRGVDHVASADQSEDEALMDYLTNITAAGAGAGAGAAHGTGTDSGTSGSDSDSDTDSDSGDEQVRYGAFAWAIIAGGAVRGCLMDTVCLASVGCGNKG